MNNSRQIEKIVNIPLFKSYIQFPPLIWLLLFSQYVLLFFTWDFSSETITSFWLTVFLNFIGIVLLVQLVSNLSFGIKSLAVFFNILVFFIFNLLFGYRISTGSSLDYILLMDNIGNVEYGETIEMALELNWTLGIRITMMIGILYLLQRITSMFTFKSSGGKYGKKLLFYFSGYFFFIGYAPAQQDEVSAFISSAYYYKFGGQYHNYELPEDIPEYPYLKENVISGIDKYDSLPHVFLIMLESCNANFMETKNEEGKEYMPFMNSLIKEGLYVENFYSNSVYTIKGQLAILTGLLPSINKNIFVYHKKLRIKSLAEILKDNGYRTSFFHAYHDLSFGDEDKFMESMDMDIIEQMDEEFITKEDQPYIWGWGLQDNLFYEKHFDYLDKDYYNNINKKGHAQPYFSILGSQSHHYNFSNYPRNQAYIYPNPVSYSQHYANSIHLEDKYLETFFVELNKREYLKNSVIIILGDHSFPSTDVNSDYIYQGFGENRFRVPLLMIAPGKIDPQRVKLAHSQMDIAPTVLDLINIKALNHFTGTTILGKSQEQHFINLVQPYDGIHIVTLLFPYKYIRNERTGYEYLFNVKKDPGEDHNLIDSKDEEIITILAKLRKNHEMAYFNQRLIEENRLWPPEK